MYTYQLQNTLYINLTNQCSNNCIFCIRKKTGAMGIDLWLDKEPTGEDIISEIPNPSLFKEVVFCGFGEPIMRLPQLLQISKYLKEHNARVRLNTNGHGNLIWGRNIVPELSAFIDAVSISLNAKDATQYNALCQPDNKELCYAAVLDFAQECTKYIPEVCLSVVDLISAYDIEKCREVAEKLGTTFKLRHTIK